jgi:ribonuclease HI
MAIESAGLDQPLEVRTDSQYVINGKSLFLFFPGLALIRWTAMTDWVFTWRQTREGYNHVQNGDLFMRLEDLCSRSATRPRFVSSLGHSLLSYSDDV